MKRIVVFGLVFASSCLAPQLFAQGAQQRAQRAQTTRSRARHYGYETQRSDVKDRQVADEEAARAAALQKSAQTQATTQQTLQKAGTGAPQMTAVQMQQRLIIINTQLKKLEQDQAAAVGAGRSAEETSALDAQIESLNQEAAGLKAYLGMPAQ